MVHKVESVADELKIERAQRIRQARQMLRLTRIDLISMGIPKGSLQSWEDARRNGLTLKGAMRLSEVFKEAGLVVTPEWLMEGQAPGPVAAPKTLRDLELKPVLLGQDATKLARDMLHLLYAEGGPIIDAILPHDGLAPAYYTGDCVAGLRLADNEITKALGKACIVHTKQGQLYIGCLSEGKAGTYQISQHGEREPQAIQIYSAAPIIFHLGTL